LPHIGFAELASEKVNTSTSGKNPMLRPRGCTHRGKRELQGVVILELFDLEIIQWEGMSKGVDANLVGGSMS
jgi:hypothetical protein